MGDAKRWTVTYTKHVKQKRKVYQDGALELHGSCEKVMLYDDCGKLLDSRFLKKDEVIESGGTLTFDTHLVDIGELEKDYKPLKDLNVQIKDEKPNEKIETLRKKANFNSSGNRRAEFPSSGTSQNCSAFIKKIVTEHKKRDLHDYKATKSWMDTTQTGARGNKQIGLQNSGRPQNQPDDVHTFREWHALYTTQITQKAKRYHDGTLRQSFCSSHQRQAMLYDDYGKLLASRFLKKDEVIESGSELAFDTHLTEIGEPKENYDPLIVSHSKGDKQTIGKNVMIGQKVRQDSSGENKPAKLKNNEATPNTVRGLPVFPSINTLAIQEGNLPNDDSAGQGGRSVVNMVTSSGRVSRDELLRDASQILNVLKKPAAKQSLNSVNLQMEQTSASQSSNLLQPGHRGNGLNVLGMESSQVDAEEKYDLQNFSNGDTIQIGPSRSNFSQSKETSEVSSLSFTNLIDLEQKEKSQLDKLSASSIAFPHLAASLILEPKLEMEFTDEGVTDLISTMGGSHVSKVMTCGSPENNKIHGTKPETGSNTLNCGVDSGEPFSHLSEYKQVHEYSAVIHAECKCPCDDASLNLLKQSNRTHDGSMLSESNSSDAWVLEVVKDEKPKQVFVDNVEPDAQNCEEPFLLGLSSGFVVASAEGGTMEEFKSLSEKIIETDDFPSFDLGI